jgi:hypothetical protein
MAASLLQLRTYIMICNVISGSIACLQEAHYVQCYTAVCLFMHDVQNERMPERKHHQVAEPTAAQLQLQRQQQQEQQRHTAASATTTTAAAADSTDRKSSKRDKSKRKSHRNQGDLLNLMDFDTLASPTTQSQHDAAVPAATNSAVNKPSWEQDLSSILLNAAPVQKHVDNSISSSAAVDVQQEASHAKHSNSSDRKRSNKSAKKSSSSRGKHSSHSASTHARNDDDYLLL